MALVPGRATFSLTLEANEVVDDLCRRLPMAERMDAAKIGLAFAIRQTLPPAGRREPGAGAGTTWGVGSFDNDGQLRDLVRAIYPESGEDPYVLIEALMNQGLVAIRDQILAHPVNSLTELIETPG